MPIRMSPNRGSSCWSPLVASGLPFVVYLGEVDVGHGLPDRGDLLELQLPGRLGEFGVEGLKQDTRDTANVRAVGHETVSDAAAVDPRAAVGAVEQGASRQLLRRSGRWQK